MKKLLPIFFVLVISLLGACFDNANGSISSDSNFNNTYEISLNEAFEIVGQRRPEDPINTANVTISNLEVESNLSENENTNETKDFITFDLQVENTSDVELRDDFFSSAAFKIYTEDGKEIDQFFSIELSTFDRANLRPDGKNSGKVVMIVDKGEVPAELIYNSNWLIEELSNEYVMKLQ
jgi:hypothetical protein